MSKTRIFLLAVITILLISLSLVSGCSCDDDDDDDAIHDDDHSDDDDDHYYDDDATDDDDDDWIEPTAWDDFLSAEREVALSNFSTALTYYDRCIIKLEDDEPLNDGPVEPITLERAEYGYVIMLITLPLRIIETFLSGWITGSDLAMIMEDALSDAGVETGRQPTSLITVYLLEIILPLLEQACDRMDHVRQAEDFEYRMPKLRFLFIDTAFEIPAVADQDGRGEHDLTEAHLLSGFLHLVTSSAKVVTSQNLDTSAARIDDILDILLSGDFAEIMELFEDFPNLLTLHDDEVVDGPAFMLDAHLHWIKSVNALHDDNDADGYWHIHDNGTPLTAADDYPDPGELPDDFYDSWQLETDDQAEDILRLSSRGALSLNIKANGNEIGSGGPVLLLNLLLPLLTDSVMETLTAPLMGFYPPEENSDNRMDDDIGTGTSTSLAPTVLTDSTASFTPGDLVGLVLNPNTGQPNESEANITFEIVDNSNKTIIVKGDMTKVANSGDQYSIGDGWIDDRPLDISLAVNLLIGNFAPFGSDLGFYLSEFYDNPTGVQDLLPAWDEIDGHPSFIGFVVDETETFTDLNGNNRYDPGIDTFVDADHFYGTFSFTTDGYFQPYYFYFKDGTMGGLLFYDGDWAADDPTDNLNRIISGVLMLIGGAP